MDALTWSQNDKAVSLTQIESVEELLKTKELEDEAESSKIEIPFAICAQDVSFGYTDELILKNVNFMILPGIKF